jgi:holliday junction DNA helicase RuvA
MIEFIKGILCEQKGNKILIEVGGIGYGIFLPSNALGELPPIGSSLSLYTYPIIREDGHFLYGFLTKASKELFELLNQVSGVGPKTALSLIGYLDLGELIQALTMGNTLLLAKAPSIGKKTADRLIMELKDKLKSLSLLSSEVHSSSSQLFNDALSALLRLGVPSFQAQQAIKKILQEEPSCLLADLIGKSLRSL